MITCLACAKSTAEYVGSESLKTMAAPARAAAVSPAKSEPGAEVEIENDVLGVSMSSGRSQQA